MNLFKQLWWTVPSSPLAELIVAEASPENALQSICRDATASCDEEGLAAAHISEAAPEAKKRRKRKKKKTKEL